MDKMENYELDKSIEEEIAEIDNKLSAESIKEYLADVPNYLSHETTLDIMYSKVMYLLLLQRNMDMLMMTQELRKLKSDD